MQTYHRSPVPHWLLRVLSFVLITALIAGCGGSPKATDLAKPSTPAPTVRSVANTSSAEAPASTAPVEIDPVATQPPAAIAGQAAEAEPAEPATSVQPAPKAKQTQAQRQETKPNPAEQASKPSPKPGDPLNKTYAPSGPKLSVPQPGPQYDVAMRSEGYTSYLYAVGQGHQHTIVAEKTWLLPGLYEKYVALSPDNRTVTFVTNVESSAADGKMKMWAIDINGENRRMLAYLNEDLWVAAPTWSPDSKRIAYVRSHSRGEAPHLELWVVDADGTDNHKLLQHPSFNADIFYGADPNPLRWTAYGDIQYKDYKRGRMWTVNGRTGEVSYAKAKLTPPKVGIPVIRTKTPIPIQSQNDPRWRYDLMDSAECPQYSVGLFGCALTTVSMSFNAHGIETNPRQLNRDLDNFACPLYWAWAAKHVSERKLELWGVWAFDYHMLDLSLSKGRPAMVWITDYVPGDTIFTHWVLVVGGSGRDPYGYRIYDPWDGTTYKTLGYYTSKGYQLGRVYAYGPKTLKKAKHKDKPRKDRGD